jgi:uncharacterized protein
MTEFMITAEKMNEKIRLPKKYDFAMIFACPTPWLFESNFGPFKANDFTIYPDRHFTHLPPKHIFNCYFGDIPFIVLTEVYGGTVMAATLEDLHHYGINKVFGVSFVGSLTGEHSIGDNVFLSSALGEKGVTADYVDLKEGECLDILNDFSEFDYQKCRVWTTNAFYRQSKQKVDNAKSHGCNVVNMETAPFYAVCKVKNMRGYNYATITDVYGEKWDNKLSETVNVTDGIANQSQERLIKSIIYNECDDNLIPYKIRLKNMMGPLGLCKSHDYNHFIKVFDNARDALRHEKVGQRQRRAILLAALLHDVDDKKLFPNNRNNENARRIMHGDQPEFIEIVIRMINLVSSSANGDSMVEDELALIPRYADRIEALGLIGIQRCYLFTKTIGNPIITDRTPRVRTIEQLWKVASEERYRSYKGKSESFIDHFYDKLLRLSQFPIKNEFLVRRGNEEGRIMVDFIIKFFSEENKDNETFIKSFL